jgi:branched-subunit amino acid transport protein
MRLATLRLLLGMTAVTFLPRFLPLALFNKRAMPQRLERFLHYMPTAIMAAIVFPVLLSWDGKKPSIEPILLLSAVPVFLFAAWKKNLWGAVLIGMAVYWALSLVL